MSVDPIFAKYLPKISEVIKPKNGSTLKIIPIIHKGIFLDFATLGKNVAIMVYGIRQKISDNKIPTCFDIFPIKIFRYSIIHFFL